MSPVKYELGFYIPEDGILHSHRRENLTVHSAGGSAHAAVKPLQGHVLEPRECAQNVGTLERWNVAVRARRR
jgi:hypothetical protein